MGIIGFAGFLIGIAWPKVAGVKVGPAVPGDLKQGEVDHTPAQRAGINFDADAKSAGVKPEAVNRAAAFFQRSL